MSSRAAAMARPLLLAPDDPHQVVLEAFFVLPLPAAGVFYYDGRASLDGSCLAPHLAGRRGQVDSSGPLTSRPLSHRGV